MTNRGIFISFEGGEGSGKSTQARLLQESLASMGVDSLQTREPGGTPLAERIRALVVNRDGGDWDAMGEALLMFAARHQHLIEKIHPALARGQWVISDRFADSSRVFQGYACGLDLEKIETLCQLVVGDLEPDLTLVFDISPEEGLARTQARSGNEDRFELLGLEFHKKVRDGYLDIVRRFPHRCVVIDAAQDIETVQAQVMRVVRDRFLKEALHG